MKRTLILGFMTVIAWVGMPVAAARAAISHAEAATLGKKLVPILNRRDAAAFQTYFDSDALIERSAAGVDAPAGFKSSFRTGFRQSFVPWSKVDKAALTYRFLSARTVDGEVRILFRALNDSDLAMNYLDMVVERKADGSLALADMYSSSTGELTSQTIHRIYVAGTVQANPSFMSRLTGADKTYAQNMRQMEASIHSLTGGHFAECLQQYHQLPTEMQEDKSMMLVRFSAARQLRASQPAEYASVMADMRRLFPNDPSLDLLGFNDLLQKRDFKGARDSVERLFTFSGGDSFLNDMRARIDIAEGTPATRLRAESELRATIAAEPTLHTPYWQLVNDLLAEKKFDDVAATLDEIKQNLHVSVKDLTKIPSYAEFVKSDAYQRWIATQKN